jgi:hypothetical protein
MTILAAPESWSLISEVMDAQVSLI